MTLVIITGSSPFLSQVRHSQVISPPLKEFIDEPEVYDSELDPGRRTALHLALAYKHPEVVKVMLQYKGTITSL